MPSVCNPRVFATVLILLGALETTARATGLATLGIQGTPVSSPAQPDLLAVLQNPALLPGTGAGVVVEGGASWISVAVDTSRHGGIDPNTGETYRTAKSSVVSPGLALAASWQPIPGRVGLGFGVSQPMQYAVEFGETNPPPFTGPQRYSAIQADLSSLALGPAVGLHLWKGLHVGGSISLYLDRFDLLSAWDAMGTEGMGPDDDVAGQLNPYTGDAYYLYAGRGRHVGGGAGVYYDGWDLVQVGLTFTHMGRFQTTGAGRLEVPELIGGVEVPLDATADMRLPQVFRAAVLGRPFAPVAAVLLVEQVRWTDCCGGRSGDVHVQVMDSEGDSLGPDQGLTVEIPVDQYSPRRLQDAWAVQVGVLGELGEANRVGASARWQQSAVPEFAVSVTNLDMETWSFSLFCDRQVGPLVVGIHGRHVVIPPRTVEHSAWDVREVTLEGDSDFVDERFSPQLPFTASTNGTYTAAHDSVVLRVGFWK
jgi:hypothetical protein